MHIFKKVSNTCKDWVLIFSRENNFGVNGGIKIKDDNKVYVQTLDHHIQVYDIDKVVFASSSGLEDETHMENIRKKWKIPRSRMITCSTIEEMFALISLSPHVISDRYHPGVAALVLGVKLTVTKYRGEIVKMTGLWRMQKYKKEEVVEMNEKAFSALLRLINGQPIGDVPLIKLRSQGRGGITAPDQITKKRDEFTRKDDYSLDRHDNQSDVDEPAGNTGKVELGSSQSFLNNESNESTYKTPFEHREEKEEVREKQEQENEKNDNFEFLKGSYTNSAISLLIYVSVIGSIYYGLYLCYLNMF